MVLSPRTFLIGPNASGKSNLLDVFRFLGDIARPGSGGLQGAIAQGHRGGFSKLRCLHSRKPSHIVIDVEIGSDTRPNAWRYRLVMQRAKSGTAQVEQENVWKDGLEVGTPRDTETEDDRERAQTSLEQTARSKLFAELSVFFATSRYLHVVPQVVRDRGRALADGEDPYGGDLLRRIKATPLKTRDPRIRRITDALGKAVPQFTGLALEDDIDGVPHLIASFKHWRGQQAKHTEREFSDGTLRLIGLLWSISERGGPLLLEEPELSLGDGIVSTIPGMFETMQRLSGRQVIATTHSAALLGDTVGVREVHAITVGENGSEVRLIADIPEIVAMVEAGMTVAAAAFPIVTPEGVELLAKVPLAS
jgi:predicted ATPase